MPQNELKMRLNGRLIVLRLAAPLLLAIGLLTGLFGILARPAQAATCTVPGTYATIQLAISDITCDIITVDGATYFENLTIGRNVEIHGTGATRVDGSLTGRVVNISSNVTVLISGTILQRGSVAGSGGGINNVGQLTLINSQVLSSTAQHGGGIFNSLSLTTTNVIIRGNVISFGIAFGGGVHNTFGATLNMSGGLIVSNVITSTIGEGGGIYNAGTASVVQGLLAGNFITGSQGLGAGLYNLGTASILQTRLAQNSIIALIGIGGGAANAADSQLTIQASQVTTNTILALSGQARGAGLNNAGRLTATNVIAAGNVMSSIISFGAGLHNDLAAEALWDTGEFASNLTDRDGGGIYNAGALRLRHVDGYDNIADDNGGGIYNSGTVTATDVRLEDNAALDGGGLYNTGAYSGTDDTFIDNTASDDGGGIFVVTGTLRLHDAVFNSNEAGGASGNGGGLALEDGSVSLGSAHFVGNSAPDNGGGIYASTPITLSQVTLGQNSAEVGAGIYLDSGILRATNLTMLGNFGVGASSTAAALYVKSPAQAHLAHATVASNTLASINVGGIVVEAGAALTLTNSLLAGNDNANCDIVGSLVETGINLEDVDTCGLSSPLINTDPLLASLTFNGGPVPTAQLKAGSPALDAAGLAECAATDARSVPRPQGAGCDIGAYEALLLSVADTAVLEGDAGPTVAVFTVTVGSAVPGPQSVTATYTLTAGTATPGIDFLVAGGTLVIPAGQQFKVVTTTVMGDLDQELDETFTVTLQSPVRALIGDGQAIGTIVDDDKPEISIADSAFLEGTGGAHTAFFTVTLSAASVQTVTVQVDTSGSSAGSPGDFTGVNTTLVFSPGVTSLNLGVPIVTDAEFEPDETFFVNLSQPVNAEIADSQGQGTILNDDSLLLLYLPHVVYMSP
jgi:predicted outer membrane repeat protein